MLILSLIQRVVDKFSSPYSNATEFGDIIDNCRALFKHFNVNSSF